MKIIRKLLYPITIIIIVLLVIYNYSLKRDLNSRQYDNIELIKEDNEESKESINKYKIDIKGAINNPGVYEVDNYFTVNDVIKIAGGLTKNADTSIINLAKKVTDEMVIIVYTKEEVKKSNVLNTVIKIVEKECVCPNIQNDGCLNNKINDSISNNYPNKLININTASSEELQKISGIGEAKAKSIIEYRKSNGNFKNIEEIQNVEGIGQLLYEQIKIYITT